MTANGQVQEVVLEDLASATNYIDWLASLAEPWLGEEPIEIGSGLGYYAERWVRPGRQLTVSEAEPGRVAALTARFGDRPGVTVRRLAAPLTVPGSYSAVAAVNVLEHIEDDLAALRSFRDLLRPGGHVVIISPAFQFAMSRFDRDVGHYRRYRRRPLRELLIRAGLQPVDVRYFNCLGLLAWLVFIKLLRGRPREGVVLTVNDRLVVPALRRLETHVHLPFGQSLLAVGRRPPAG